MTFVLLMLAVQAKAQKLQFGVKAGIDVTREYSNHGSNSKFGLGTNAGLAAVLRCSQHFALEADLQYTYLTGHDSLISLGVQENSPVIVTKEHTSRSHFITIPVVARFEMVKGLSVEAGPQFGFCVSREDKLMKKYKADYPKNIFEFSLVGGLCYDISKHIFIDARYIHGLTKPLSEGPEYKCRNTIQLSAGYIF